MRYGGWSTTAFGLRCDAMPVPSDPGWKLERDSHGCNVWTNPNDTWLSGKTNSATTYCGAVPGDAGTDSADAAADVAVE